LAAQIFASLILQSLAKLPGRMLTSAPACYGGEWGEVGRSVLAAGKPQLKPSPPAADLVAKNRPGPCMESHEIDACITRGGAFRAYD